MRRARSERLQRNNNYAVDVQDLQILAERVSKEVEAKNIIPDN